MPDEQRDTSGNTQQFRAFASSGEPATAGAPSKLPLIIGVAVVAVLLIVLIAWLAAG